jgi:hypothetical protein
MPCGMPDKRKVYPEFAEGKTPNTTSKYFVSDKCNIDTPNHAT